MAKLQGEDVMVADLMERRGWIIRTLAGDFGVDESTLRYRLKRLRSGAQDGRKEQAEACGEFERFGRSSQCADFSPRRIPVSPSILERLRIRPSPSLRTSGRDWFGPSSLLAVPSSGTGRRRGCSPKGPA